MSNWEKALSPICEIIFQKERSLEWILVGSAGSVLQGCEMTPGDIDIYVKDQESVGQFADMLQSYSLPSKVGDKHDENWLSSVEEPTFTHTFPSGFTWTKGRWKIEGVDVEVVNISNSAGIPDSQTGDGIWEGGKYIWDLYKNVSYGPYTIRTVPLEIQLESNYRRQRKERIDAIIKAMQTYGYNEELLKKALSSKNLLEFYTVMGVESPIS
ncbi:hypothetical protein [Neobacillus sp. PS2-9]|uniref:hypothetical protein n=1 Tax=Neobacillus sp. PS2-9 TaxID=3070676 RepID=UPI0027DF6BC7|nr:hypothetical protein [Neobacillus sp. PS2-9]WML57707.1 hypothetical protein RCG25_22845 [Neobacillus sp. PS2-9]